MGIDDRPARLRGLVTLLCSVLASETVDLVGLTGFVVRRRHPRTARIHDELINCIDAQLAHISGVGITKTLGREKPG